jgi:hypothetical protein
MDRIKFFCVTNKEVNFLEKENYKLCWVGSGEPPKKYLRCDNKINIYNKEKYYSELTFHYWYWKNILPNENDNQWIGFCQKRRYWINCENATLVNKENINQHLYEYAPENWEQFDVILCKPLSVSGVKKSKILKRGFKNFLREPSILFDENKQNLFLHFDMHHGYGNLQKAINVMPEKDKTQFEIFMRKNTSFNPHIMFISKPKVMNLWFENLFEWLEKCEKQFRFQDLKGYDTQRLLAYLSERYLSYWFQKNFKCKEVNWVQLDNF